MTMSEKIDYSAESVESHVGKNVVFGYAVQAYRHHLVEALASDEKTQDWVFHTFHSMHLQNPGLFYTKMHDHNAEELVERVLKNAATVQKSMSYKCLLRDFLAYCSLHGWSPKAEKGANLIQLPPPREYPFRPRKLRGKMGE